MCSEARLAPGYRRACVPLFDEFRAGKLVSFSCPRFLSPSFFRTACDSRQSLTMFVGSTDVTLGLSDKRVRHNPGPRDKTFDSSRDARLLTLVLPAEGTVIIRCSRWTSGLRSIITNRRILNVHSSTLHMSYFKRGLGVNDKLCKLYKRATEGITTVILSI